MIDVNLRGVLYGINATLPQMIERKDGHVVIISSIAALQTFPSQRGLLGNQVGNTVDERHVAQGNDRAWCFVSQRFFPGGVKTELGTTIKDPSVLEMMDGVFNFEFLEPEKPGRQCGLCLEPAAFGLHRGADDPADRTGLTCRLQIFSSRQPRFSRMGRMSR